MATLFERDAEVDELADVLEAARTGSGGLVLVEGPAGIGKTRLLEAADRAAAGAGMEVLRARGVELEEQFAFGVVRQLFEAPLAAASARDREKLLDGSAALAGSLLGVAAGGPQLSAAADVSFALVHGLYWLCFNVAARKPLLVVIDDAHWADAASLRWVSFVAARLVGLPVSVVLAVRPNEPGVAREFLMSIRNDPCARVLRPAALSERGCERLICEAFALEPVDEFGHACFVTSGGNPFYLRALVDGLVSDGVAPDGEGAALVAAQVPDTVVRSLLLRLSRLPPATAAVSRALAVLGADSELWNVAALAGLDASEAAYAADLLADAGILAPGRPLRFMHPIIEAAIDAELPVGERSRMHLDAARLLAGSGAAAERIASHVFASEPAGNPWSVGVLREAAAAAVARGAPDSALSYLERAQLEAPDADVRAALMGERGSVEFLLGEPAMIEHLREALDANPEPSARARISQKLAIALGLFAGRPQDGVSVLERALDSVGDTDQTLARAIDAELLAMASQHVSTRAVHARHLARARALQLGDGPSDRALLANLALWNSVEGERASVVRALAERALAGGRLLADVTSDSPIFYHAAAALYQCEAVERCRYWLDEALADARARGSLLGFASASGWRSEVSYRLGELGEAEADARAAIEAAGTDGWVLAPAVLAFLAQVLVERGELGEADRLLTGSQIPFGLDRPMVSNWLPFARAQLQIARGELRPAVENLLCVGEWLDAWRARNPALLDWRTLLALALAGLGELDRARELSDELLALTEFLEQPCARAIALRTAGLIAGGADGVDLLREAAAMIAPTPARLERARTLIELGAALRRGNHRKDAREPLRDGAALAQRCGATRLAERGLVELRATGARPRRLAVSGLDALTPSERRIAELAASGLSNPAIAQHLFVTINTVEGHLRHVYQKLSISSRQQLATALRAAPPVLPAAAGVRQKTTVAP